MPNGEVSVGKALPYFLEDHLTPTWQSEAPSNAVKITDLNLIQQDKQLFTEQHFHGKNNLIAFIFTSCIGFCPTLVKKLQRIEETLPKNSELHFTLITVDPEHDTHRVLKSYAQTHDILTQKNWTLVTGNKEEIYSLIRDTFASEVKNNSDGELRNFAHTERFYLIDKNAHLRAVFQGRLKGVEYEILGALKKLARPQSRELSSVSQNQAAGLSASLDSKPVK